MKKVIKKGLSCLLAGLMTVSGISSAFAVNGADENIIDLSHENPGDRGATFGVETDSVWRWQTFEATKDGVIDNVEVYVVKRNPEIAKPGDLVAAIYPITDGQAGEALQTVTVPEAQVNDKAPTSIDFDVQVEAGKRYALALSADPLGQQDAPITQPTYDWVKSDIGLNDTLPSGKILPSGAWADESFLGTYWSKFYYGVSNTIDLSHENPGNRGSTFGDAGGAVQRWQTFEATKDGVIGSVEVYVVKRTPTEGDKKPGDLVATIYPITDGQAGEALQTVTVPEAQVNDKASTSIDFNVQVEAGKRYALALSADPLGQQDAPVTQPVYDWVSSNIGFNDTLPSGKIVPDGSWVNESFLGTYWSKFHYASKVEDVPPVDFTFDTSEVTWGYGVGAGEGEAFRYQTFTAPASARMTSVEVFLLDKGRAAPPFANLIAKLYDTNDDGTPKTELTSVTKPYTEIPGKGVYKLDLAYQMEAGKRYAVVLTTDKLAADNSGNNGDHYNWPARKPAQSGEYFGAMTPAGVATDQTDLGTAYLKVNFNEQTGPTAPVPTKVELTADKTILKQGDTAQLTATVLDQYGVVMEGETVDYTSDKPAVATVDPDSGLVTAVGEGVAAITATCGVGGPESTINFTVADATGMLAPVPGMIITDNVKFKPGDYDFGGSDQGITVRGDNITVDGTDVRIFNAKDEDILADVTTGAFAYQLNPVDGKTSYCLTREFDFSNAAAAKFSFDSKIEGTFAGSLKVYASEDGGAWTELKSVTPTNNWEKTEVDLNAYAGKTVKIRVAYENSSSTAAEMSTMGLKLDTFEIFEDGVRTFSDLCSSKVFYWWKVSYGDEAPIETPSTRNKPFDRTAYNVNTSLFKGTALTVEDSSNVTIKGFDISGFYYAMEAYNSNGLTIENNNFSDNFTNPNGGWGDQLGGAVLMENVNGSTIRNNVATNNANGLYLRFSDNNVITDNNFSDCSDVCLELWNSSKNRIEDNDFSWGIRIDPYDEVHARDSTSSLIEAASNYNYVKNNDFTHGGDGIFVRALNGMCSEYNVFEGNDTSFANNNAVECGMGRNYWFNNKANWSSYGFWMGGSDENVMIGNEMGWNGIMPANAPTGEYGNSGISMVGWSSEHEIIVNNYIHDNAGAGIGMKYRPNQPSFNGLIQNNRIVNNGQAAIDLENADWFEINGNVMEGNGLDGVRKDGDYVTNIIEREGAQYQENYEDYLKLVPEAVIESAPTNRFAVGEEVSFTAENSTDPNGKPLTFRWEMGDGTVLAGESVRYTFKEPGFYDVAVSATNGDWTDIAWISVNVVAGGAEIGTESLDGWGVTDNGGKTTLSLQAPNEEIPNVGGVSMEHPIYYVVDGNQSVKMTSTSPNNTLTYPQSMDAGFDFSNEYAFGFSMKLHNQNNRNGANSPIVTLHTDADNYITYTPSDPLMFPHSYETFTEMQYRHEWVPVNIPLEGGNGWVAKTTGTPDFSKIDYITIKTQAGGPQRLEMWIDGMKTISKDTLPAYGANIAADGAEITSSAAADSQTGVNQQVNLNNKWVSNVEKEGFYGVTFSGLRNIDQVNFYAYYQPTGLEGDVIGLPNSYEIQYLNNGEWTPVTKLGSSSSVAPNENIVKFDMVRTTGIRVVLKNADGMAASLYGFQAINSNNYAGAKKADGSPAVEVKTSINSDITVNSVDMYICVADEANFPDIYSDFLVFIYEASADGRTPVGNPVGKGVLPLDEIEAGGLNKPYNIKITDPAGGDLVLKAGATYVLGATQDKRLYANNQCYRWPTSSQPNDPDGVNQFYGKYEPQSDGTFTGAGTENLGTGWMRVYTDRDANGKPLIDYSHERTGSGGYGVGCESGEVGRYQTFTFPVDPNGYTIDGKVESEDGWATRGSGETDFLSYGFEGVKDVRNALVFLDGVPEKVTIKAGSQVLAEKTKDQLKNGENVFTFAAVNTGEITVEILNGADGVTVREVELMGVDIPEETVVDKNALKAQIDKADSLKEADYTADSWANMKKFYQKAKDVYNDPDADQTAVNNAAKDLEQAIKDLKDVIVPSGVDKTELNRAIKYAESLKKELYTEESWAKMQEKLKAARDAYGNPDADQAEVNLAAKELDEAVADLVLVTPPAAVDKSSLSETIYAAETISKEGYTDSSWRWFQSALEEAKAVLDDPDATQAMVDSAEARLKAAIEGLTKVETEPGDNMTTGDWLVTGVAALLVTLTLSGAGIMIFRRKKHGA